MYNDIRLKCFKCLRENVLFCNDFHLSARPWRSKTGYEHKQTNDQSCQRKRNAVLDCATQLHCRQCHCSCEMVLQNPVLHFPKYWSCKCRSCFFRSSIFSARPVSDVSRSVAPAGEWQTKQTQASEHTCLAVHVSDCLCQVAAVEFVTDRFCCTANCSSVKGLGKSGSGVS